MIYTIIGYKGTKEIIKLANTGNRGKEIRGIRE